MKALAKLSPRITDLIRLDHKAVDALFDKYDDQLPAGRRRALANTISLTLGLHAELEQELLYPFLRPHAPDLVEDGITEHIGMFRRIIELRKMDPEDAGFDDTVRDLIREVRHHVQEEEREVLPLAERVLAGKLRDLGAQMTRRRFELAKPVAGKVVRNAARAYPGIAVSAAAALGVAAAAVCYSLSAPAHARTAHR